MSIGQTTVVAKMTGGFPGLLADTSFEPDVVSYVSDETSKTIGFGLMLQQGSTSDSGALLLTGNTNKLVGIVVHSHAYEIDQELSTVAVGTHTLPGLLPGITLGLLQRGRIWVEVDEAVAIGDPVRVRCDSHLSSPQDIPGQFCKTADAGHTLNITPFARWITSTTGAGVAILEIDSIANRSTATAD